MKGMLLKLKIDTLKLQISTTESIFIPYIVTDSEFILVDTGYPNMIEQIEHSLSEKGLYLADVTQIWLTHHDHDHVGSLAEIKRKYPGITIKTSKNEITYIEGKQMSLRLQQAVEQQEFLSKDAWEMGLGFQSYLKTIIPCNVDDALIPGESILNGEMIVLDTAGHTSGHISFYASSCQTLIAGDLVVLDNEILMLPFPQYAFDLERVRASIMTVSELPIQRVICYHGGCVEGSIEEIRAMLQRASN